MPFLSSANYQADFLPLPHTRNPHIFLKFVMVRKKMYETTPPSLFPFSVLIFFLKTTSYHLSKYLPDIRTVSSAPHPTKVTLMLKWIGIITWLRDERPFYTSWAEIGVIISLWLSLGSERRITSFFDLRSPSVRYNFCSMN